MTTMEFLNFVNGYHFASGGNKLQRLPHTISMWSATSSKVKGKFPWRSLKFFSLSIALSINANADTGNLAGSLNSFCGQLFPLKKKKAISVGETFSIESRLMARF